MLQQSDFVVQTTTIAREFAVGPHHAMAGNDEADGVPSHCAAYRLRRFNSQPFSNVPISHGLAEGYLANDIQHRLAERRLTFHTINRREIGLTARKIDVQPTASVADYGRHYG